MQWHGATYYKTMELTLWAEMDKAWVVLEEGQRTLLRPGQEAHHAIDK